MPAWTPRSPPAVFNYDTTWLYGPLFSNAPRGEKWGRTMRPEIGLKEQASERASIQVVHKVFARGGSEGHYGSSAQVGKELRERAANVRIHFLLSFPLSLSAMRRQFPSFLLSLLHHFLSGPIPFLRRPWPAQIFLLPTLRKGKGKKRRGGNRILALRLNGFHGSFPLQPIGASVHPAAL